MDMNVIIISGRIGKDPELKTGANGTEYTSFSVAVDRRKKQDEEKKTDWFRCKAFGQTAVFIEKYFKKGDGIEIVGRMENNQYKDKETDKTINSWEVPVDRVYFPKGRNTQAEDKNAATGQIEGFTPVSDEEVPF